jgi:hypothetical protein
VFEPYIVAPNPLAVNVTERLLTAPESSGAITALTDPIATVSDVANKVLVVPDETCVVNDPY